ncbi:T9SS type A sorting domain-containing protein [Fluviicola chungangensis]|uniref:T9SS type A sorting domain-containing protein n=1 Tax=Fluviicola chungangensis TaxID=2597671 RepID=A0A556MIX4_9FLAO|nr:T9SS type A sorting domain-containing protein [Fluviicola chungangensis]TSJ39816.1 T9SS type A sorting domain-containing protein [Fluviicola chungangensis]
MKNKLLIIFALIGFTGFSQSTNWIKGNAIWHYKFYNYSMPGSGYIKVWDDGDTLIQNKVCTKLKAVKHDFEPINAQWELQEFISDYISGIVYYSNDTVYRWYNDQFEILYDFSAQAGDSWLLLTGVSNPPFSCNDTSICVVESVGSIHLGGNPYPELQVNYSPGSFEYFHGKINSRFGPTQGYLFPMSRWCDSSVFIDIDQITFICFEDDSLNYNPTGESCEYYLGLSESELSSISIFPNPSEGKIELLSDVPLKRIRIVNLMGVVSKEFRTNLTLTEIDLSELPRGTYYLNIEKMDGESIVKKVELLNK